MTKLYALIRRNTKLYFRDKGMFLTSLITPMILLVLYGTFLGNIYEDSFRSALDAAGKYPFVLLHINGADEASHRKDAMEKRVFLSRVDAEIVCPLATNLPFFIVTGDHAADPRTGTHESTPQPVFVNGFPGKFPDFLPFFPR